MIFERNLTFEVHFTKISQILKGQGGILDEMKEYLYQEKWLKGTLGKKWKFYFSLGKCKYISTYSILLTDRDIKKCQKDPLWQMFITAIPTFAYCTITAIEVSSKIQRCNEDLFLFYSISSIWRSFYSNIRQNYFIQIVDHSIHFLRYRKVSNTNRGFYLFFSNQRYPKCFYLRAVTKRIGQKWSKLAKMFHFWPLIGSSCGYYSRAASIEFYN